MVKISNLEISPNSEPIIIAEMSGNHNQSLDRALSIVDSVANSGAHILKLQTYRPDTITLDIEKGDFLINEKESLWYGRSFYSLYKEAHTPWEWQKEIFIKANKKGLICFSSVFDASSVHFLEELNVPAYKIASQECIHLPLLREVALTNKPIVISTGMASLKEIDEAVNEVRKTSSSSVILMKCTSSYPADPANSNIMTIPFLKKTFGCEVGLSDHTAGIGAALSAVAHGATLVEKHLTLSRTDGGVDSAFSLEPHEMKLLVEESKRAWQSLGSVFFGPTESEKISLSGRRSIYVCKNIKKNEIISEENIAVVRPNKGLAPKYYYEILGMSAKCDLEKGTPISLKFLKA